MSNNNWSWVFKTNLKATKTEWSLCRCLLNLLKLIFCSSPPSRCLSNGLLDTKKHFGSKIEFQTLNVRQEKILSFCNSAKLQTKYCSYSTNSGTYWVHVQHTTENTLKYTTFFIQWNYSHIIRKWFLKK